MDKSLKMWSLMAQEHKAKKIDHLKFMAFIKT